MTASSPKISVFTTMPKGVYAGGRYHSMMLAYSLSRAGADVTYVTNNLPLFDGDFAPFDTLCPIRKVVTEDYADLGGLSSEWVVIVPTSGFDYRFYNSAIRHARENRARIALLSFETPNWFNVVSPFPRSAMPTESWRLAVAGGGVVATVSAAGVPWAREYYGPHRDDLLFDYCHPAINDLAAEAAREALQAAGQGGPDDRRRITMFVRTEDRHKGAFDLFKLPRDIFDGHILALVFGGRRPTEYVDALRRHFAPSRDFAIEAHDQISDEQKFILLGRSRLLLFPSYFEGFGYPPVEAAEMGTPSVAYDIKPVHEVAGDAVAYAPPGDTEKFAQRIREILSSEDWAPGEAIRNRMRHDPGTMYIGRRMIEILRAGAVLKPAGVPPAAIFPQAGGSANAASDREAAKPALGGVITHLTRGRLSIKGTVENAKPGAALEFFMPGAGIADVLLHPGETGAAHFSTFGEITSFPIDERDPSGGAEVQIAYSGSTGRAEPLGSVTVVPDWATLLIWPDASTRAAMPTAETPVVKFVVTAEDLTGNAATTAKIAAIADVLDRMGRKTLCLLVGPSAPSAAGTLDLDALPRFHDVVTIDSKAAKLQVAEAVNENSPLVLSPGAADLLSPGADAMRLATSGIPNASDHVLIVTDGPQQDQVSVAPDDRLSRRSLSNAFGRGALLVIVPSKPVDDGLPLSLVETLSIVESQTEGLDIALPRRLWRSPLRPSTSVGQPIQLVDQAELARLIAQPRAIVGVTSGDGGDPLTISLLQRAGAEVVAVDDKGDAARLIQAISVDLNDQSPFAAFVADTFAPKATLFFPSLRRNGAVDDQAIEGAGMVISDRTVLSFSTTLRDNLVKPDTGWIEQDVYGIRMGSATATLQARLDGRLEPGQEIETLVQVRGGERPWPELEIRLNGHLLISESELRPGFTVVRGTVPMHFWAKDGAPQTFTFHCRPDPGASADGDPGARAQRIKIFAMALSAPSPAAPFMGPPARLGDRRAPLLEPSFWTRGSDGHFTIGQSGSLGPLSPGTGWSNVEDEWVWSDGKESTILLSPPATLDQGIVEIALGGSIFPVPDRRQRVSVSASGELVAQSMLPGGGDAALSVAFSADRLTLVPLDHLELTFPDACSPQSLGSGDDPRVLALALRSVDVERFSHLAGESVAKRFDGNDFLALLKIDGPARGVALRIRGSGSPPAGHFVVAGRALPSRPVDLGGRRWEVCLRLADVGVANEIRVGWVWDSGYTASNLRSIGIDALEIWSRRAPPSDSAPSDIELRILPLGDTASSPHERLAAAADMADHYAQETGGVAVRPVPPTGGES